MHTFERNIQSKFRPPSRMEKGHRLSPIGMFVSTLHPTFVPAIVDGGSFCGRGRRHSEVSETGQIQETVHFYYSWFIGSYYLKEMELLIFIYSKGCKSWITAI